MTFLSRSLKKNEKNSFLDLLLNVLKNYISAQEFGFPKVLPFLIIPLI